MKFGMEQIRELDRTWRRETTKFLKLGFAYGRPHPLFLEERQIDAIDLPAMAKKWGIPVSEVESLRKFIAIKRCLSEASNGEAEFPFPEDIATAFEIEPANEFVVYFHEQLREIHETLSLEECEDGVTANG